MLNVFHFDFHSGRNVQNKARAAQPGMPSTIPLPETVGESNLPSYAALILCASPDFRCSFLLCFCCLPSCRQDRFFASFTQIPSDFDSLGPDGFAIQKEYCALMISGESKTASCFLYVPAILKGPHDRYGVSRAIPILL